MVRRRTPKEPRHGTRPHPLFGLGLVAGPLVGRARSGQPLARRDRGLDDRQRDPLVLLAGTLLVITRLYVKTKASEAFVRTGMGGMKVIQDGGALVIPVVHQIVRVSLETLRLDVGREGPDALITNDKLRADVRAEFYVRVQPDEESIRNAARSLGEQDGRRQRGAARWSRTSWSRPCAPWPPPRTWRS